MKWIKFFSLPRLLLAASIILALFGFLNYDSVRFVAENIRIEIIDDQTIAFTAEYRYQNVMPWRVFKYLAYPLIIKPDHPLPHFFSVQDDGKRLIPELTEENELYFPLNFPAQSTKIVKVYFLQKAPSKVFHYLLTTTRTWGRPLEKAEFSFITGQSGQKLVSCSVAEHMSDFPETLKLAFDDFWPAKDLELVWTCK
jgi:hypothetical protein